MSYILRHSPTRGKPRPMRLLALIVRAESRHDRDRTIWTATMVGRLTARLEIELRTIMAESGRLSRTSFGLLSDDAAQADSIASFIAQRLRAIDRQADHLPVSVVRELEGIRTAARRLTKLANIMECRLNVARHGRCQVPHTHEREMEIETAALCMPV